MGHASPAINSEGRTIHFDGYGVQQALDVKNHQRPTHIGWTELRTFGLLILGGQNSEHCRTRHGFIDHGFMVSPEKGTDGSVMPDEILTVQFPGDRSTPEP